FGALALLAVPAKALLAIIFFFALYFLLKKLRIIPERRSAGHVLRGVVAVLSGFLEGTGLSGSDLRNQYLYAQGLRVQDLHGTTAVIGGANFLVATVVRLQTDHVSFADILFVLWFLPIIIAAT